ncbi:hypothetical protein COEREDRAFT_87818 [Coemansia reversa NRRL 1564]|uniref:Uncharacterized protein n=1 Tax=Coemansia reversa (strain ATCC 12441 / NRRL 1564) TaxID=763665 RepID=A0A2G5B8Q9_COERN|nr:hypothetical protein COEREDRAFT_87818 [Coemansia reversa NRRL 1564]|eukprot:PIA15399.1 hypothetical protein COEREDRAFT_87818 [Coemansia reversa NRRL 1564]
MSTLSYAFAKVTTGFSITDALLNLIENCFRKISNALQGKSWGHLIPTIKEQIFQTLESASIGSLTIEEDGECFTFGNLADAGPHVRLTVLSEQFWVRLMLVQDLGFAEAYMAGEITVTSLVDFVRFYIYNRAALDAASSSPIVRSLMYLASTRFGNSILNTASNVSAHYDLGNEMFEMFLDSTMTYSCAVWDGPDHYARTLRVWRERFLHGFDKVLTTAAPKNAQLILQERELAQKQQQCRQRLCASSTSSLTDIGDPFGKTELAAEYSASSKSAVDSDDAVGYDEVFRRKWEYYFAYCEGAFATRTLGCTQLVFTRTYNEELSNKGLLC